MKILAGNTELLNESVEDIIGMLKDADDPFPLGMIIDTRSKFGAHLAIDIELAGEKPRSHFEAGKVIKSFQETGQYQAALDKAATTVLELNAAKKEKGEIPIYLGVADRLSWESKLREYAAQVDDYYRDNLEAIVSLFKQCEAKVTGSLCPVVVIEHYQTAYFLVDLSRG